MSQSAAAAAAVVVTARAVDGAFQYWAQRAARPLSLKTSTNLQRWAEERASEGPIPADVIEQRPLISVIGDMEPGLNPVGGQDIAESVIVPAVLAQSPHAVIPIGDFVPVGRGVYYQAFVRKVRALSERFILPVMLTVLGNHDRSHPLGGNAAYYDRYFGDAPGDLRHRNYVFEDTNYRFVVLDSSLGTVTKEQMRWLDQVLAEGRTAGRRLVVFTHMPPRSMRIWTERTGQIGGKTVITTDGATGFVVEGGDKNLQTPDLDPFMQLLDRHGVEELLSGHVHAFDVQYVNGVRCVLIGNGGSPQFDAYAAIRNGHKFFGFLTMRRGRADGRLVRHVYKWAEQGDEFEEIELDRMREVPANWHGNRLPGRAQSVDR